jgi:hypothetical protein
MDLRDLHSGFRDDDQRSRAAMVVHRHLADDRDQEECRYLLKFQWQLSVSYTEVTIEELREHVGAKKLVAVEDLIVAIGQGPDSVELWIRETVRSFPEIKDRGYEQWEARSSPSQ